MEWWKRPNTKIHKLIKKNDKIKRNLAGIHWCPQIRIIDVYRGVCSRWSDGENSNWLVPVGGASERVRKFASAVSCWDRGIWPNDWWRPRPTGTEAPSIRHWARTTSPASLPPLWRRTVSASLGLATLLPTNWNRSVHCTMFLSWLETLDHWSTGWKRERKFVPYLKFFLFFFYLYICDIDLFCCFCVLVLVLRFQVTPGVPV